MCFLLIEKHKCNTEANKSNTYFLNNATKTIEETNNSSNSNNFDDMDNFSSEDGLNTYPTFDKALKSSTSPEAQIFPQGIKF